MRTSFRVARSDARYNVYPLTVASVKYIWYAIMIDPPVPVVSGARVQCARNSAATLTFTTDASTDSTRRVRVPVAIAPPGPPSREAAAVYVHESPAFQAGFSNASGWGTVPPVDPSDVSGLGRERRPSGLSATAPMAMAATIKAPAMMPTVFARIPAS